MLLAGNRCWQVWDPGSGIRGPGFGIRDSGFGIRDSGSGSGFGRPGSLVTFARVARGALRECRLLTAYCILPTTTGDCYGDRCELPGEPPWISQGCGRGGRRRRCGDGKRNRRDRRRGATSGSGQGRLHAGAGRTDAGARDGAPPGRARRDDRRRPGLRLHGRCAQEARLRVHRRQPGIELQRPSRIVHQLRRQHRAGVDHVLPRAGVGEHRERLLRGGRQADGRDHVRAIRSASRDDGHLRRLLSAYANLPPRREHPRRQRAATRVRLGPAFRGRSGCRGPRHGEVGRHTAVAAALRRVGRARLQDGDDRATRPGRARRRRHASGERGRRSIEAPHPQD